MDIKENWQVWCLTAIWTIAILTSKARANINEVLAQELHNVYKVWRLHLGSRFSRNGIKNGGVKYLL